MDTQDKEFKAELNKRLVELFNPTMHGTDVKLLVNAALDGMIKDKLIGPAFYQEVDIDVNLGKDTGVLNVSFAVIDPTRLYQDTGDLL